MKINTPLTASLYLTDFCQLKFNHCFHVEGHALNKNTLTLSEIKNDSVQPDALPPFMPNRY